MVFSVNLGLSKSLVFFLYSKHSVSLLHGGFIFEHTSHASDSISLSSVSFFFSSLSVMLFSVLTLLLLNPSVLLFVVVLHALVVHEILTFELTDTRDVHRDILRGSIKALSGTFHCRYLFFI